MLLSIWRFPIFIVFLLTVVSVDADCQSGYTTYDNKTCYKVYTTLKTRAAAEVQCEADSGFLASPSNGFDNSYILTLGQNVSASSMWLGTECYNGQRISCGNEDETPFGTYDNFHTNNPSTAGNCVYMSTTRPTVGMWLSFNCKNTLPFVCEQDYNNRQEKTTCPDQFSFFKGMCYKVLLSRMRPSEGLETCQHFPGGNLASVHSLEVNQFLYNLSVTADSTEKSFYIGLKCPNVTFNGDTSSCYWFDNTPVDYTNFLPPGPENGDPYTPMRTDYGGQWSGEEGDSLYPICQAPPT